MRLEIVWLTITGNMADIGKETLGCSSDPKNIQDLTAFVSIDVTYDATFREFNQSLRKCSL